MADFKTIDDLDMDGKVVLTRVDVNVPVEDGRVTDATRIEKIVPTIKDIQAKGGIPVLLAHFDRPKGKRVDSMSLKQIVPALEAALGQQVVFADDCIGGPAKRVVADLKPGDVALLENTRFYPGEEENEQTFTASLAALGQAYVNDAFSAAHRAHPQATAWRGIQRRILQFAVDAGRPEEGVSLARELAMTTYRTAEEFHNRFETTAPQAVGGAYPVCEYLTARGQAYRTHTTPARWVSMSDSLDRHSVTPEAITTPVTLIGFTSDRLVPIDDIRELAARLPTLWRFVEAPSLYGHDAFLKEDAFVGDILRAAFKDIKS